MLFANKQNLETELKVSLLSIRERELTLYSSNCRNIAGCTALLTGFSLTSLMYEKPGDFSEYSAAAKGAFELMNYLSVLFNTAAMFGATVCAMLGPGLALRGADGAMDQAVEGLALEFRTTFILFFCGVTTYFLCFSAFLTMDYRVGDVWDVLLHVVLIATFLYFLRSTVKACKRIYKKFRLPPEVAVSGAFDPDGRNRRHASPEAIELQRLCDDKHWWQWPRRQYLYLAVFMNEFVGVSSQLFEERYAMSAPSAADSRRPNNMVLHRIISYLEQPQQRGCSHSCSAAAYGLPAASATGSSTTPSEDGAGALSARVSERVSGGVIRGRTGRSTGVVSRGPQSWMRRFRGGEDAIGLAGSDSAAVELSAINPSDNFLSGAISPADSSDEIVH